MSIDPATLGVLGMFGTTLGATVTYILRERSKHKTEKSNNGDIKAIKKTTAENLRYLNKVDKNLGIVSTNVENMQKNCAATTERFEKDIDENREDIKGLLKTK